MRSKDSTGRGRTALVAAARFASGVVVAVGGSVAAGPLLTSLPLGPFHLAIPVMAFMAGGAIAGESLGVGVRGVLGFAIAFVLSLPIALFSLITIQGLGGDQSFGSLAFYFGLMGAFAFGIMGVVGTGIAGLRRDIVAAGVVFGAAGFLGGALLAASLSVQTGSSTTGSIVIWSGLAVYFVLPPVLGGVFLGLRLRSSNASGSTDEPM